MKKKFTFMMAALALLLFIAPPLVGWGQTTYEQLTSIANIDESAQYVLGIDETGFHYEGTSSWGKTALPSAQTPIYYTLTKASDGNSFTAQAIISGTTYYLQIPTSNTFSMATSTGTNTDIIIGTTQISGTNYAVANKSTTARHLRINGASGLRSYAGTTGTMAFFYKVIPATPAYTIIAQSNNDSYGTVSLSGSVITGSPNSGYRYADPAYTVSPANSATVAQNGNEFTVTPSANTTVTINFEAIPCYTVTLSDDTEHPLTEASAGAGVTLPSRSAIGDYSFAGWSVSNVSDETTTAPTIIPAGTYHPTSNITLYPVYTRTEGSSSTPSAFSVGDTGDFAIVSEKQNGKYYALPTNPTVNSGKITAQEIEVSETGGVKYVTPTDASGFTWTIASATNGYTLYDGSNYIYHSNGGDSGTNLTYGTSTSYTWSFTKDSDYVKMFGMDGSTTNSRGLLFQGTTIGGYALSNWGNTGYYKSMILPVFASEITYYWSSPVLPAVEKPVITVAENPFLFSTNVTIICTTEGATIYYTTDGNVPSSSSTPYTAPFNINSTTTIKAIAIKGTDASSVASATATKNLAEPTVTISGELTLDLAGETSVEAGTLSAVVTYNDASVPVATVTWSSNNTDIAEINASTGDVTIKAVGEVTFTATYAGNSDYAQATGTKTVTVTDSNPPGTENHPYTVAQARAAIDAGTGTQGVYVAGIIFQVDNFNSNYNSITYWISDDGTSANPLEVYSGISGIQGFTFSSTDDLQIGDEVIVRGNLKKYNSTYEFDYNNELVSLVRPQSTDPIITVTPATVNAPAAGGEGTLTVTYENITTVVADVYFCNATGTEAASYDWITAGINAATNNVEYLIEDNDGAARTAYLKVWAYADDETTEVYSNLVTVTQAAPVVDYVTLPFNWAGGVKNDLTAIAGVSGHGLGTDYADSNAPYRVKFDTNGDYILIKTNEQPAVVSVGIKKFAEANTSSLVIQGSSDGESFKDVQTFSVTGAQNATFTYVTTNAFAATDRYVRIYFNKPSGGSNVGVGPISIYKLENIDSNSTWKADEFTPAENTTYIVDNNVTLTLDGDFSSYFDDATKLIIEDGGQLITSNAVAATVKKNVEKANNWGAGEYTPDGWYFIALPLNSDEVTPSMLTTGDYDLYQLNTSTTRWENYKAHDGNANPNFKLANGKAYLYANSAGFTVDFAGTVKASAESQNVGVSAGWNLVGNPFTYNTYLNRAYYKINSDRNGIEIVNNNAAIAPCTGVLVKTTTEEYVTFTQTDQTVGANHGNINIALAQTVTTRGEISNQTLDNAIVSFNEGSELGKFYFGQQNANIYIPMDNEEYAIVSTEARGEMPVNFKAAQDGQYTITVNAEEVEMGYLHLIDNIAGVDVDLLANPSYSFNAKADDYESRFRLVFSANNENQNENEKDFAFFSNGQLIVTGEGTLHIIDMMGRVISTEVINGTSSKAINAKAGVYVLRLTNGENVKTQKIVVR